MKKLKTLEHTNRNLAVGFFDTIRAVRKRGTEGFQRNFEELLGDTLSSATDSDFLSLFTTILQEFSGHQWRNSCAVFWRDQSLDCGEPSALNSRSMAIIKKWEETIRMSINFPGYAEVTTQRIYHIEKLKNAMKKSSVEGLPFIPEKLYDDTKLKCVISEITEEGIRQFYGYNEFLDDIKLLYKDLESGKCSSNPNLIHLHPDNNNIVVKILVLRINKLSSYYAYTKDNQSLEKDAILIEKDKLESVNRGLWFKLGKENQHNRFHENELRKVYSAEKHKLGSNLLYAESQSNLIKRLKADNHRLASSCTEAENFINAADDKIASLKAELIRLSKACDDFSCLPSFHEINI
ncbi:MAG: hypothetical protein M3R00_04805 [Pseudomonadota bacterium]|nr:hypothetical protein [Pseudomonadota bacterium]